MKKILFVFAIALFLVSCGISTHYVQSGSAALNKTTVDKVLLYSGKPNQNYIVIGSLAAYVPGDGEKAALLLKKEAASIGADAIIFVKLDKINSYSTTCGISGVAVKLQP